MDLKLTEAQLENQILQWLTYSGFFAFKLHDQAYFRDGAYRKGSPFQIRGQSDVVAIRNGEVFFIEIKTKTGKQSEHQKEFESKIKASGGNYMLVRSIDEVRSAFKWPKEIKI